VYDFTAFDLSQSTPNSSCVRRTLLDINDFALLNRAYGRWSPNDESHAIKIAQEQAALRKALFRTSIADELDDDIPFL